MSLANLAKVLKCAGNDDIVTLKANDDGDTVTFMFESPSEHAEAEQWAAPAQYGVMHFKDVLRIGQRDAECACTLTRASLEGIGAPAPGSEMASTAHLRTPPITPY
jgi:hypothetical protein